MKEELKIKARIVAKIIDGKTGKVKKVIKHDCHTFLKNFSEVCILMFPKGDAVVNRDAIDISGISRGLQVSYEGQSICSYTEDDVHKAFCRIGTSAVTFYREQYGPIDYLAQLTYSGYEVTDTGSGKELVISFGWTNDTGESKDVAEACLGIRYEDDTGMVRQIALTRDVFSPAFTIPDGDVLALGYYIAIPW